MAAQVIHQAHQLQVQLLEPPGHVDRPAAIAEVALDLADDHRDRIALELDAALGIEAVDRLDQADRPDLDEILVLLAAACIPARHRAHQREVFLDQTPAGVWVMFHVDGSQQLAMRDDGHRGHRGRLVSTASLTLTRRGASETAGPAGESLRGTWAR